MTAPLNSRPNPAPLTSAAMIGTALVALTATAVAIFFVTQGRALSSMSVTVSGGVGIASLIGLTIASVRFARIRQNQLKAMKAPNPEITPKPPSLPTSTTPSHSPTSTHTAPATLTSTTVATHPTEQTIRSNPITVPNSAESDFKVLHQQYKPSRLPKPLHEETFCLITNLKDRNITPSCPLSSTQDTQRASGPNSAPDLLENSPAPSCPLSSTQDTQRASGPNSAHDLLENSPAPSCPLSSTQDTQRASGPNSAPGLLENSPALGDNELLSQRASPRSMTTSTCDKMSVSATSRLGSHMSCTDSSSSSLSGVESSQHGAPVTILSRQFLPIAPAPVPLLGKSISPAHHLLSPHPLRTQSAPSTFSGGKTLTPDPLSSSKQAEQNATIPVAPIGSPRHSPTQIKEKMPSPLLESREITLLNSSEQVQSTSSVLSHPAAPVCLAPPPPTSPPRPEASAADHNDSTSMESTSDGFSILGEDDQQDEPPQTIIREVPAHPDAESLKIKQQIIKAACSHAEDSQTRTLQKNITLKLVDLCGLLASPWIRKHFHLASIDSEDLERLVKELNSKLFTSFTAKRNPRIATELADYFKTAGISYFDQTFFLKDPKTPGIYDLKKIIMVVNARFATEINPKDPKALQQVISYLNHIFPWAYWDLSASQLNIKYTLYILMHAFANTRKDLPQDFDHNTLPHPNDDDDDSYITKIIFHLRNYYKTELTLPFSEKDHPKFFASALAILIQHLNTHHQTQLSFNPKKDMNPRFFGQVIDTVNSRVVTKLKIDDPTVLSIIVEGLSLSPAGVLSKIVKGLSPAENTAATQPDDAPTLLLPLLNFFLEFDNKTDAIHQIVSRAINNALTGAPVEAELADDNAIDAEEKPSAAASNKKDEPSASFVTRILMGLAKRIAKATFSSKSSMSQVLAGSLQKAIAIGLKSAIKHSLSFSKDASPFWASVGEQHATLVTKTVLPVLDPFLSSLIIQCRTTDSELMNLFNQHLNACRQQIQTLFNNPCPVADFGPKILNIMDTQLGLLIQELAKFNTSSK